MSLDTVNLYVDADLLRDLIASSGLSQNEFAQCVMRRDPRAVRRWLAGEPAPTAVYDWLRCMESVTPCTSGVTLIFHRD